MIYARKRKSEEHWNGNRVLCPACNFVVFWASKHMYDFEPKRKTKIIHHSKAFTSFSGFFCISIDFTCRWNVMTNAHEYKCIEHTSVCKKGKKAKNVSKWYFLFVRRSLQRWQLFSVLGSPLKTVFMCSTDTISRISRHTIKSILFSAIFCSFIDIFLACTWYADGLRNWCHLVNLKHWLQLKYVNIYFPTEIRFQRRGYLAEIKRFFSFFLWHLSKFLKAAKSQKSSRIRPSWYAMLYYDRNEQLLNSDFYVQICIMKNWCHLARTRLVCI